MYLRVVAIFASSLLLTLITGHVQTYTGPSFVQLEFFENDCGGWKHVVALDGFCYNFTSLEDDISGVFMRIGSCAKIIRSSRNCDGESFTIRYPNYDYCRLPCCGWDKNITSVIDCETRASTILCPEGSYVREVSTGAPNQGMTISCFEPTGTVASLTENTHGIRIPNPVTHKCPIALFGMSAFWNYDWQMVEQLSVSCQRLLTENNSSAITQSHVARVMEMPRSQVYRSLNDSKTRGNGLREAIQANCEGQHEVVAGIEVIIDEADVIKKLLYYCSEVPNPSETCEPMENLTTVVSCDNRESQNELQCSFSRTLGVGLSKTMTEIERKEYEWSVEVGFEISTSIDGLGESMSSKLGNSELVDYEWSVSDNRTWHEEVTESATIDVKPHTWTVLQQLTGKCTFYGVQVNYFRTIDMDRNGKVVSERHFKY